MAEEKADVLYRLEKDAVKGTEKEEDYEMGYQNGGGGGD